MSDRPQPGALPSPEATRSGSPPRRHDVLALLALVLLPLCLLGPSVFGPSQLLPFDLARYAPAVDAMPPDAVAAMRAQPSNLDASDVHAFLLPELEVARQQLRDGTVPAWNPAARFGAPLFANGLAGLAYPPNLVLHLVDDPRDGLAFLAWFAFALAGCATFGLLRCLGVGTACALFGGTGFALCGTLLANTHYYGRMHSLVWLPAMLLCVARAVDANGRLRVGALLALAACVAMAWLAGFPPWAAMSTLATGAFAVTSIFAQSRRHGPGAGARLGMALFGAAVLGLGLAAIQLAPLFSFYPETNRDLAPGADAIARNAFDPMGFLGYLLPAPFGHPMPDQGPAYEASPYAHYLFSRRSWEDGAPLFPHNYDFAEYTVFPGSLVLILAIVGGFLGWRQRPQRFALVVCAGLALLATAPAFLADVLQLPGVQNLKPMRWIGLAGLFVAMLAAVGLQVLAAPDGRRRVWFAAAVGVALAVAAFSLAWFTTEDRIDLLPAIAAQYRERLPRLTPDGVAAFLGDGLQQGREWLHAQSLRSGIALAIGAAWIAAFAWFRRFGFGRPAFVLGTAALTVLEVWLGATGVVANTRLSGVEPANTPVHAFLRAEQTRLANRGGVTIARAGKATRAPIDLPIGTLYADGIRDLNSFAFVDAWSHRLFAKRWGAGVMGHTYWPGALPDDEHLAGPLLDLMGVRYLLSCEQLEHAGTPVGPGGTFYVYERPQALPRAFVVHALDEQADDAAIVRRLCGDDLEPRAAVVVDAEAAKALGTAAAGAAPRDVHFTRDDPTAIDLSVPAGAAGYLVLADSFFSGWTATIDGEAAPIARGNLFMRVIRIPDTACQVRFRYTPPGLLLGSIVTGLSVLVFGWLLFRSRRRRRVTRAGDPA